MVIKIFERGEKLDKKLDKKLPDKMPSFFCLVFEFFRGSGQALAARAVALLAPFA
jgi:hypothetical protein